MRLAAVLALLLWGCAVAHAQPDVPTNTYRGYAHADCAGDAGVVRIVLPAGATPIPGALPPTPARPAVELVVQGSLDAALGKPIPVQEPPAAGTLSLSAMSCPVVGSCSRARTGTLTFERAADGGLSGQFRIRWPDEAARTTDIIGKFTARWFDSGKECR
jgi:hypothetical protein